MALTTPLGASLARVRRRIDEAALRAGRDPSEVALVAVSKAFPVDAIEAARREGQRDFGENRVQELVGKAARFDGAGEQVRWHFVGRLQRNKVRQVVATGAVIHSVDRPELAAEISRRAEAPVQVLIEVNLSGEEQKGGVAPERLRALAEQVLELPNLELTGLMTMARKGDAELARPVFRGLARLRDDLAEEYSGMIHHLSMGMSQDYEVAIEEGATLVRVGEAVFGPRAPRQAPGPDRMGESER